MAGSAVRFSAALFSTVFAACAAGGDPSETLPEDRVFLSAQDEMPSDEELESVEDVAVRGDFVYPSQVDLRQHMSPVRNQRSRGTCSAFATTALAEFFVNRDHPSQRADLSEQMTFYLTKTDFLGVSVGAGSTLWGALRALKRTGTVAESVWPYEPLSWASTGREGCTRDGFLAPDRCVTNGEPPEQAESAARVKISSFNGIVTKATTVRSYLATKNAPVAFLIFASGDCLRSEAVDRGVFIRENECDEVGLSAHSMLIVGYDDEMDFSRFSDEDAPARGGFIVRNSWGANWGDFNGYGHMSYEFFDFATYGAYVADGVK